MHWGPSFINSHAPSPETGLTIMRKVDCRVFTDLQLDHWHRCRRWHCRYAYLPEMEPWRRLLKDGAVRAWSWIGLRGNLYPDKMMSFHSCIEISVFIGDISSIYQRRPEKILNINYMGEILGKYHKNCLNIGNISV